MVRNLKKMSRAATVASLDSTNTQIESPFSSMITVKRKRSLFNQGNSFISSSNKQPKSKSMSHRQRIKLKDQKTGKAKKFPCFDDAEVFILAENVCIREVSIEADFDCESSDELIESMIREQKEEIRKSLENLSN